MRRPTALFLTPVLALLVLVAGCKPAATTPVSDARRSQTLILGNSSEPGDLDPQTATALTEMNVLVALFEGLTCLDEKTSQPIPGIAEKWEITPDGLTYTFHLRATARWSNGDPLTAHDFAWSFQRILSPKLASEYSYMLWPIKNAQAYNNGKVTDFAQVGVRVVDDRTLELTLGAPCPWLLALAAHQTWFPVHRATLEKFGATDRQGTRWTRPENMVSDGPFTFKEWSPNARIVVEKNPQYWDSARTTLNRVEFLPIENLGTEEKTFRAGGLHLTYGLQPSKIPTWLAEAPADLRADPFLESFFLRCNVTKAPLNNPKVRQALARAIDRTQLAATVLHGSVVPAHALTPPGTAGYQPPAGVPDDFAAARKLLAEAGFPEGKGFPALEVQIKADDIQREILEAIQQMWSKELGIQITIVPLEQKIWLQNQEQQDYQISSARWVGDYVDPDTYLNLWLTNGGNNWTGWSNADYDRLVKESAQTMDTAKRQSAQAQAETLLLDQGPIIPIYYGEKVYLIDPSVKGWVPNLLGVHRYQFISLD